MFLHSNRVRTFCRTWKVPRKPKIVVREIVFVAWNFSLSTRECLGSSRAASLFQLNTISHERIYFRCWKMRESFNQRFLLKPETNGSETKWNVKFAETFPEKNFPHENILKYLNPISHNPLLMLTLNSSLDICLLPFLGFTSPTSLKELFCFSSVYRRSKKSQDSNSNCSQAYTTKHHLNTKANV